MTKENFEKLYNKFLAECDKIAAQCEEEGYPAHGSNYDLRVEKLMKSYPELFEDDDDDDDWEDFEDEEWED